MTAPLQATIDGDTLILRCYVPECQREVARFKIATAFAAREREQGELRQISDWLDKQLDDIRFYSGTPDGTWRRLVAEINSKIEAALASGGGK